jgi:hypothetical protein
MMRPMRSTLTLPVSLALAAALCSCQAELEAASEVTKLRILGVQADPPEIPPGGETAIRVLTADPNGAGRRVVGGGIVVPGQFSPSSSPDTEGLPPLYYALPFTDVNWEGVVAFPDHLAFPEYYLAPNPAFDPGDPDSEEHLQVPIAPPGEPLTMTAILVVCAGDGFDEIAAYAALEAFSMAGDAAESMGALAFEEICAEAGADEGVAAIKTFTVAVCDPATSSLSCDGEYEPNANPEIESVDLGGVPLVPLVGGVCLECDFEDGCREPFAVVGYLEGGSFQRYERKLAENLDETEVVYERTYISWFLTGGKIDEERSGNGSTIDAIQPDEPFEANWIPPFEGGDFTLWAVAHDIRGGVSWEQYQFTAGTLP